MFSFYSLTPNHREAHFECAQEMLHFCEIRSLDDLLSVFLLRRGKFAEQRFASIRICQAQDHESEGHSSSRVHGEDLHRS